MFPASHGQTWWKWPKQGYCNSCTFHKMGVNPARGSWEKVLGRNLELNRAFIVNSWMWMLFLLSLKEVLYKITNGLPISTETSSMDILQFSDRPTSEINLSTEVVTHYCAIPCTCAARHITSHMTMHSKWLYKFLFGSVSCISMIGTKNMNFLSK